MATDIRYLNNRLKYHTASRVPKQAGDSLAASFNVDGHTVTTKMVWAAAQTEFPTQSKGTAGVSNDPIGATTNLITVFKDGGTSTAFWNGGLVWTNPKYPAVKLYENVPAVAVTGSDGDWPDGGNSGKAAYFQSFEVLAGADGVQEGTIRVKDWVAPTSVEDSATGSPEAGFTGIFQWDGTNLQDNDAWTLDKGTWEFVYIAGMLTFEYNATPQKVKSATITAGTKTKLTITAFKYDGAYLGDYLTDTITDINHELESLETEIASSREIDEVTVLLTDGTLTPSDSGKAISSSVTEDSATGAKTVTVTINAEVLSVKEIAESVTEEAYPDIVVSTNTTGGITSTLTADYGTRDITGISWQLTYRI